MDFNPARVDKERKASDAPSETVESAWLRTCIDQFMDMPDSKWLRFAGGYPRTDSVSDLTCVGTKVTQMASDYWAMLLKAQGPTELLSPMQEINRHGVTVVEDVPGLLDSRYIHFAAFDPTKKVIYVSVASVERVTQRIVAMQLDQRLGSFSVMDVVLWHECFHVWSHVQRQIMESEPWDIRHLFRHRSHEATDARTLEELTAIEFSRQACGIAFHPQLLQWLLISTYDSRRAFELAQNILEKS